MKNDLERLQSLTRNYNWLLGWPIAMGLLFLMEGVGVLIWGMTAVHLIYGWLFLPNLALMAVGAYFAARYHQRKFGTVKARLPRRAQLGLAVIAILYVVLILLGGADFKNLKVALEPTVLNAGIMMVLAGLLPAFPWKHYIAFGALLIGIAFLPGLQVMSLQQFYRGWNFVILGSVLIVCGIVDRLILAHNLASLNVQEGNV